MRTYQFAKRTGQAVLFTVFLTSMAFATPVQRSINYQGKLTDTNGNAVANGTYSVTFRLYDDPNVIGTVGAKWVENHPNVATQNGYFNVVLGSFTPLLSKNFDFNQQYWLGIQIESDSEMSPRLPLNSMPSALNSDMPIGTILAWHKSKTHTPQTLPEQWAECNGQVINDPESPYDQDTTPNLNGAGGTGRFLRGSDQSGVMQTDDIKNHSHNYTRAEVNGGGGFAAGTGFSYGTSTQNTSGVNAGGTETRPVNMSVVWIMKIK